MMSLLGAAACFDVPEHPGPLESSHAAWFEIPIGGRSKLDLLFVIDRSTAMAPYRTAVLADLPGFIELLDPTHSALPDLNVAVTTAHAADGGAFRTSLHVDGSFVIDGMRDGVRVKNYTGELASALVELADVGASEGTPPRPLDALSAAVARPEFLRDDAWLAIVMIDGADDTSTSAVQDLAATLKATKSDPVKVSVIGVQPTGSTRLDSFLSQFPNRSMSSSIDASEPITSASGLLTPYHHEGGRYCLEWTPLDVDPETPGDQVDCSVEQYDTATKTTTTVSRCSGDVFPCWDIREDRASCTENGKYLAFDLGPDGQPYEGATVSGQCVTDGNAGDQAW
jgi:hypothetical protein